MLDRHGLHFAKADNASIGQAVLGAGHQEHEAPSLARRSSRLICVGETVEHQFFEWPTGNLIHAKLRKRPNGGDEDRSENLVLIVRLICFARPCNDDSGYTL